MTMTANREDIVRTPDELRKLAESDLRAFLKVAEERGEVEHISGADPNLEMGALYELSLRHTHPPVLLFDNVKGYPAGRRVLMNVRSASVLGEAEGLEAVKRARQQRKQEVGSIPPTIVEGGPVLENVLLGDQVDIRSFPTPTWHEFDGGPYIGTECMVINQDPDTGWVNVGTYRVQVHDRNIITVFIEPGKHGNLIRQKYWDRGEACPMVVCVGQAPILGRLAGSSSRHGESEFAVAGGRIGRSLELVRGRITGLPFPADAELAFEGFMPPVQQEARAEGPFGEWPGYYASDARPEPIVRVEAVYHRNDPIIVGQPPAKPTLPGRHGGNVHTAAAIWDSLEAAGVPGVKGVWKLQGGGARFITVVAIEQLHPGHAKMAGLVATGCGPAAYLGRITVVVDDDIDITDPVEVMWALATRWDPKTQTDIVDGCWTGHIDPLLAPQKREVGDITNSRAILYATRPYHWKDEFPRVNAVSADYAEQVRQKWASELSFLNNTGK